MRTISKLTLSVLVLVFLCARISEATDIKTANLRCEYKENPLGIDVSKPRLSWEMEASRRGQKQTAYHILVASSSDLLDGATGDLWDSGKVQSTQSIHIAYAGASLIARQQCFWKVRVWDKDGKASDWSASAFWTMGMLEESDWQAKWICPKPETPDLLGGIEILKAMYVAKDGTASVDVTKHLQKHVKEGRLNFTVDPKHLGGDPAKGHLKELKLKYKWNKAVHHATAIDFATLTLPETLYDSVAAPYLRRTFSLDAAPEAAMAYVNVKGYYELYINGQKVSGDVLSPAVSDLNKHLFYRTYDIRPLLRSGENCVGLWLARGWSTERPTVRAELDITVNGKDVVVGTDRTWTFAPSSHSRLGAWSWGKMGGECIDARKAIDDWSTIHCETDAWLSVQELKAPEVIVSAQPCPPNRIGKVIPLASCKAMGKNMWELDFGTNLSGWLRIRFPKLKSGQKVVMHYADKRPAGDDTPKGPVGYQTFNQFDEFVSAGKPGEKFCSKFNYHGFRYVIVEGLSAKPGPGDAEALLIESDLKTAGEFSCSNDLLNRIHQLNVWTLRCLNLGGYMVDCPHRERLGYGDGQTGIESQVMNHDAAAFYAKWAVDWLEAQDPATGQFHHTAPFVVPSWGGPGWGGAGCVLPWKLYLYYGDRRIVKQAYVAMRRYLEFLERQCVHGVLRQRGDKRQFLGDWVPPGRGMDTNNWPLKPACELFNNCYRVYLWQILERSARVLGKTKDAEECAAKLNEIRPLIHAAFYDAQKGIYVLDEQSYQLMPLMTGVVPKELRGTIMKRLEDIVLVKNRGHLDTGMLGTYFLIQYLEEMGRNDLLYTIFSQKTYPGWGYMLSQGATTCWEQWNGYYSHIHSCFTSPGGWFYQGLAGILPDKAAPGFKRFIIKPAIVGDLTWVKSSYNSMYGQIVSNWNLNGKNLTMEVVVPPNTTATVYVPAKDAASVTESEKLATLSNGVTFLRMDNGTAVYTAVAGRFRFKSVIQ